jgi:hypothetical protein
MVMAEDTVDGEMHTEWQYYQYGAHTEDGEMMTMDGVNGTKKKGKKCKNTHLKNTE